MRALKLIVIGLVLFFASPVQSQVSVSLHLGSPPQWGPQGYSDARYYYLPDVEAYYDIQRSVFIYNSGGVWVHRAYLPSRYRDYDLYGGYKVVMSDYRGNTPYTHFREYRSRYARGYRGHDQRNIGERPERGYDRHYGRSYGPSYQRMNNGNDRRFDRGNDRNYGRGYDRNEGRGNDHNNGRGNDHNNGRGNDHGEQDHGGGHDRH